MGLVDRVRQWLRGGGEPPRPDELVDLCTLPLHEGPMTVEVLRQAGIEAVGHEAFSPATGTLSRYVVQVPFASLEAAEAVLNRP